MAKLINGNGNPAVYAAEDADLIASIMGDKTSICNLGSKFAATASGANVIEVADGVIITKEGRRIQLDSGLVDEFSIPAGTAGTTNYYIIGYKLYENAQVQQVCETFVQLMPNSTDVIQEDTFKGGATEVYVSLYRVEQDGVNLGTITALLPEIGNISEINTDLSETPIYDKTTGKWYERNNDGTRGDEIKMASLTDLLSYKPYDVLTYLEGTANVATDAGKCYIIAPSFMITFPNYTSGDSSAQGRHAPYGLFNRSAGSYASLTDNAHGGGGGTNSHDWRSTNNWGTSADVSIDLFKAKQVNRVSFIDNAVGSRNKTLYNVVLQYSDNNSSWTNASNSYSRVETSSSAKNPNLVPVVLNCSKSSKHRYWRLHYTRANNTANEYIGFTAISVIGFDE